MNYIKSHGAKAGAVLSLSTLLALSATAEPYNFEVDLHYTTSDADVNDIELDEDNFYLSGTYYFQPVDTTNRSLREAPFLDRASYVEAAIDIRQVDDDLDNMVDTEGYTLRTKLIDRESGWYGRFSYTKSDPDFDTVSGPGAPIVGFSPEYDGFSLAAGRYVLENTTVELSYTELSFDDDDVFDNVFEGSNDTIGVGARHFGAITEAVAYSLAANYHFVDLQVAEFDELDDDPFDTSGDVFSVTAMVYPLYNLGFGLSYADADDLRGMPYLTSTSQINDGLGLIADWFFNEAVSLHATYNNREYDLADPDDFDDPGEVDRDSLTFGVRVRF